MKTTEKCIDISIFDLFKIGPGPSSSHTIGPMKAAKQFLLHINNLPDTITNDELNITVHLYGSLSSTGKGHGTDRSITAGLLACEPETCNSKFLANLMQKPDDEYFVKIKHYNIKFTEHSIFFHDEEYPSPYQNTVVFKLESKDKVVFEQEYYSIGGGFIKCKGEAETVRPQPVHCYNTMLELKDILSRKGISLTQLMLENEMRISGLSEPEIYSRLDDLITVMSNAVGRGINTDGILPGPIKLARKAPLLFHRARKMANNPDRFLTFLNAYSLAASEENADGNQVVTAPTSGSSGVLPGIIYMLKHHFFMLNKQLADGLLAAAAIGFIARQNASISGAEVGCQGEVGIASAMGAALTAYINEHNINIVANAAEIALEHHLGLTCDPIDGYVQIPCIERNAVGAITAYNAYLLASVGNPNEHKISFDEVVNAMMETGRDMNCKYKETAQGGLAVCSTCC